MAEVFLSRKHAAGLAGALLVLATEIPAGAGPQTGAVPASQDAARVTPGPASSNANLLGEVKLDKEHRRASFSAAINQRTGVVEYAVVTATGKTHESVFRTQAEPQQVHLALLLLGAKPANTNFFPADLSIPPPGDRVALEVAWNEGDREVRRPLEDFIITTNNGLALSRGPWAYNGSYLAEGKFVAQRDGSIVSIQIDPNALINNPRPGRWNDDLHYVNTGALPADTVPLQISVGLLPTESPAEKSSTNRAEHGTQNEATPPLRKRE